MTGEVTTPSLLSIENDLFYVGEDSSLVDLLHKGRKADDVLLGDLSFRLGYPYIVRHSTKLESDFGSEKIQVGNCDHVFAFSELRMATLPLDKVLLDCQSIKVYQPAC